MVRAFPISKVTNHKQISISTDILDVSNNFSFTFENAGYVHSGKIYTVKVEEITEKPITLGDILQDNVDEDYYLSEDQIKKFEYLKGKKQIPRVSKTGYKYIFSEGGIPFPDLLDKPSRTILTSESIVSRTTHVVKDPHTNRLRRLTPVEVERLQGFTDEWTNTGMPIRFRYFCMGNALVVPMVTRMAKVLNDIVEEEANEKRKKTILV